MTGRDCILRILNGEPPGRVAWTTLVDYVTRSVMPPDVRAMPVIDFCRHIGCDILQFGNYALPRELCVPSPARLVTPPIETEWRTQPDGLAARRQTTPWGTLVATFRNGHPIKHPVETLEELRILRKVWEGSRYVVATRGSRVECSASGPLAATGEPLVATIGDDGLWLPTLDPSPVQQLIEMDMGLATFYYHLEDHPADLEALLDAMHACRVQEYEIVARLSPAPTLIPVENTSTTLTSPSVYRRYSLPQIRDYGAIAHRHGKKLILHMCGKLRGLLGELAETGLDGINALTPPPVGDLPFEVALDALGDRLIILGGILDPALFQAPSLTRDDLWRALDALFTPRLRRAPFLLWLPADGLPTPVDRFLAVREWMSRDGAVAT